MADIERSGASSSSVDIVSPRHEAGGINTCVHGLNRSPPSITSCSEELASGREEVASSREELDEQTYICKLVVLCTPRDVATWLMRGTGLSRTDSVVHRTSVLFTAVGTVGAMGAAVARMQANEYDDDSLTTFALVFVSLLSALAADGKDGSWDGWRFEEEPAVLALAEADERLRELLDVLRDPLSHLRPLLQHYSERTLVGAGEALGEQSGVLGETGEALQEEGRGLGEARESALLRELHWKALERACLEAPELSEVDRSLLAGCFAIDPSRGRDLVALSALLSQGANPNVVVGPPTAQHSPLFLAYEKGMGAGEQPTNLLLLLLVAGARGNVQELGQSAAHPCAWRDELWTLPRAAERRIDLATLELLRSANLPVLSEGPAQEGRASEALPALSEGRASEALPALSEASEDELTLGPQPTPRDAHQRRTSTRDAQDINEAATLLVRCAATVGESVASVKTCFDEFSTSLRFCDVITLLCDSFDFDAHPQLSSEVGKTLLGHLLVYAAERDDTPSAMQLVLSGTPATFQASDGGWNALMHAATNGNENLVYQLIRTGSRYAPGCYRDGHPARLRATSHTSVLSHCHGGRLNAHTTEGLSALSMACKHGHLGCARTLLAARATLDGSFHGRVVTTPLMLACANGNSSCVGMLLNHAELGIADTVHPSALSQRLELQLLESTAAGEKGSKSCAALLQKFDTRHEQYRNIIDRASRLVVGFHSDATPQQKKTRNVVALAAVICGNVLAVVKWLSAGGRDDINTVRYDVEEESPYVSLTRSLLGVAADRCDYEMVACLLSARADPNLQKDREAGTMPLLLAVTAVVLPKSEVEMATALLPSEERLESRRRRLMSRCKVDKELHAQQRPTADAKWLVVEALLKAGADPSAQSRFYLTVTEHAIAAECDAEIVELLETHEDCKALGENDTALQERGSASAGSSSVAECKRGSASAGSSSVAECNGRGEAAAAAPNAGPEKQATASLTSDEQLSAAPATCTLQTPSLPGGFSVSERVFFTACNTSRVTSRDPCRLTHSAQCTVLGLGASGAEALGARDYSECLELDFGKCPTTSGNVHVFCHPTCLSREPPPPLPGGFLLGECVYYVCEKSPFGGQQCEIAGPSIHKSVIGGLSIFLEGHAGQTITTSVPLTDLSRTSPPSSSKARVATREERLQKRLLTSKLMVHQPILSVVPVEESVSAAERMAESLLKEEEEQCAKEQRKAAMAGRKAKKKARTKASAAQVVEQVEPTGEASGEEALGSEVPGAEATVAEAPAPETTPSVADLDAVEPTVVLETDDPGGGGTLMDPDEEGEDEEETLPASGTNGTHLSAAAAAAAAIAIAASVADTGGGSGEYFPRPRGKWGPLDSHGQRMRWSHSRGMWISADGTETQANAPEPAMPPPPPPQQPEAHQPPLHQPPLHQPPLPMAATLAAEALAAAAPTEATATATAAPMLTGFSVLPAAKPNPQPAPLEELPEDFVCPITQELMCDPVIASDGHTYERSALERWLQSKMTSPKSGVELEHALLFPNHLVRGMIREWQEGRQSTSVDTTTPTLPPLPNARGNGHGVGGRGGGRGRGRGGGRGGRGGRGWPHGENNSSA